MLAFCTLIRAVLHHSEFEVVLDENRNLATCNFSRTELEEESYVGMKATCP